MRFDVLCCREGTKVARGKRVWGRGTVRRTHARHQENRSSRFKRTPAEGWGLDLRPSNQIIPTNVLTQTVSYIYSRCINVYL